MSKHQNKSVGPHHLGQYVRTQIIEALGLSVTDAAQALGVHRVALSRLLNEQSALSAEMAIRFQKAFGADFEELMRMQNDYDIAQAKSLYDGVNVTPVHNSIVNKQKQLSLHLLRKAPVSNDPPDVPVEKKRS